jgi:hypothetical protein
MEDSMPSNPPMTRLGAHFSDRLAIGSFRFWKYRVLANTNEVLDEIEGVLNSDPRNIESRANKIAR